MVVVPRWAARLSGRREYVILANYNMVMYACKFNNVSNKF